MQLEEQRIQYQPITWLKNMWQTHSALTVSGFLTVGLLIFFIAGLFLDERMITGAPAWLKPTKFAISISIYTFTLLWFLSFINTEKRWRKILVSVLAWTVAVAFALEWVAIITQALRGTTSHFNVSTSFDAALWGMMGSAIMVLFIANVLVMGLLLFQKFDNPTFAWALRLGMIITLVGLAEGYLMTDPTTQQLAGWEAGESVTIVGAHSVGVEDGGEGLPFLTWSTEGGDLRVGHSFGMHAWQVIPFIGWLLTRRRRFSVRQQVSLVVIAASSYLSFVLLVTWQALRAEPFIQPGLLTVSVFTAIVLLTLLASWLAVRSPRRATTARLLDTKA